MRKILFIGSSRYDKIIGPLRLHYNVIILQQAHFNIYRLHQKIYSAIKNERPDVLLCDDYQGIVPMIVGYIAKRSGIPYIIRPRGAFWHRLHDRYEDSILAPAYRRFFSLTRSLTFSQATGVLPISNFLRDQVLDRFPLPPNKVITVNQAVDLDRFSPFPECDRNKHIIVVTGFNFKKKYMALVHHACSLKRVLEENPDWKICIFGGGHAIELCKREMKMAMGDLNPRVEFMGKVPNIEDHIRRSKILLHLTYRETYPNVVLEAMASSVPVVVNRYGGNHEALSRSRESAGNIIDSDTELYQSLTELISSQSTRLDYGQAGRRYVQIYHSKNAIGSSFQSAIEQILGTTSMTFA